MNQPDLRPDIDPQQLVGPRGNAPATLGTLAGLISLAIATVTLMGRLLGSRRPDSGRYVELFGSAGMSLALAGVSWRFKRARPRLGRRQPRIALAVALFALAFALFLVWAR